MGDCVRPEQCNTVAVMFLVAFVFLFVLSLLLTVIAEGLDTDHELDCYIRSVISGITPRLDSEGNHVCVSLEHIALDWSR